MRYWLLKSEPDVYSINDLQRDRTTLWHGVRNYQARNFLREMAVGELALFYHSNAEPPGIAGVCAIRRPASPDPTQYDRRSEFYDPRATPAAPRWFCPEVEFRESFNRLLPLDELRRAPALKEMVLLQRGSRLSVQPVSVKEWRFIERLVRSSLRST